MSKKKEVYVVLQTQPDEDYFEKVIRIYDSEEKAEKCARNLNKSYGYGCKFNEHGDYEETLSDEGDYHYYEWEARTLDEEVDEVEEDPNYPYVLECWSVCSNGYSYEYKSMDTYVSEKGKTKDINKAKKFTKWEDAWKFAHTLESIGAFKDIVLSISSK